MQNLRVVGTYTSLAPFNTEFYVYTSNMHGPVVSKPLVIVPEATPENCPANATLLSSGRRILFTTRSVGGSPATRPTMVDIVTVQESGLVGLINLQSPNFTRFVPLDPAQLASMNQRVTAEPLIGAETVQPGFGPASAPAVTNAFSQPIPVAPVNLRGHLGNMTASPHTARFAPKGRMDRIGPKGRMDQIGPSKP